LNRRDEQFESEVFANVRRSGIDFEKYKKVKCKATAGGEELPQSVQEFKDIKLHEVLMDNLKLCSYAKPTPIQQHAIPILLNGFDMLGCAQTGSGKTAAFLLPSIQRVLEMAEQGSLPSPPQTDQYRTRPSRTSYPYVLCVGPTRELVHQIFKEAQKFAYRTGLRPQCVYGGTRRGDQRAALQRGCEILVGTTGRLNDFIQDETVGVQNVQCLILDEADRMLDMGFKPDIDNIMRSGMPDRTKRQTMMFSATFPTAVQEIARAYLKSKESGSNPYAYVRVGRVGSTVEFIDQQFRHVPRFPDKMDCLINDAKTVQKALVFVNTKRGVDEVCNNLQGLGISAASIHGDHSQETRMSSLAALKKGDVKMLIATDVASRGLDIPEVSHVINFDVPRGHEALDSYTHRIGRTGHSKS